MPILYTHNIMYGKVRYRRYSYSSPIYVNMFHIAIDDLLQAIPSLSAGDTLEGYIIAVHDERRIPKYMPKPPIKISKLVQEYEKSNGSWGLCLAFPEKEILETINATQGYYVTFIFTLVDFYKGGAGKVVLFPREFKLILEHDEINLRIYNTLSRISKHVLTMVFDDPILNKAVEYVLDAYLRYLNDDLEGTRMSLRNAIQIIRDDILDNVERIEGIEELAKKVKRIVKELYGMSCFGGPHPGPLPRISTEFLLVVVPELINYVAILRQRSALS